MHYLLFGASTAHGQGDYQHGGWATRLRLFIDRQQKSSDHTLTNLSISANTTKDLLKRLEPEAKRRLRTKPKTNFAIIIPTGTNDSKLDKNNPQKTVSPTKYSKNLQQLITASQSLAHQVILIGPWPVVESRTTPYKHNHHFINSRLKSFNLIAKKLAQKNTCKFINIFSLFKDHDLKKVLPDGLHPNTLGHKLIFKKIKHEIFTQPNT